MVTEIYWGILKKNSYRHIYVNKKLVEFCFDPSTKLDIHQLRVIEDTAPDEKSYWGWLRKNSETYSMIYPEWLLFNMSFPMGALISEKAGSGRIVRLKVEKISE